MEKEKHREGEREREEEREKEKKREGEREGVRESKTENDIMIGRVKKELKKQIYIDKREFYISVR